MPAAEAAGPAVVGAVADRNCRQQGGAQALAESAGRSKVCRASIRRIFLDRYGVPEADRAGVFRGVPVWIETPLAAELRAQGLAALARSEAAADVADRTARRSDTCPGCGGPKDNRGAPVLCWPCFKGERTDGHPPFKYFEGANLDDWLRLIGRPPVAALAAVRRTF